MAPVSRSWVLHPLLLTFDNCYYLSHSWLHGLGCFLQIFFFLLFFLISSLCFIIVVWNMLAYIKYERRLMTLFQLFYSLESFLRSAAWPCSNRHCKSRTEPVCTKASQLTYLDEIRDAAWFTSLQSRFWGALSHVTDAVKFIFICPCSCFKPLYCLMSVCSPWRTDASGYELKSVFPCSSCFKKNW